MLFFPHALYVNSNVPETSKTAFTRCSWRYFRLDQVQDVGTSELT